MDWIFFLVILGVVIWKKIMISFIISHLLFCFKSNNDSVMVDSQIVLPSLAISQDHYK